jgi:hypothetical protein
MAKIYEMIGRFVVGLIWMRFSRELKVAGIIFGALAAGGIYLIAKREPPEG